MYKTFYRNSFGYYSKKVLHNLTTSKSSETIRGYARSLINKNANRPYDLAIRYGGEEILLFLPYSDNKSAVNIVENIRKEIEDLKSKITISAGLIHKQICSNDNLYDIIDLADKLLYEAKRNGRNMIINYEC